MPFHHQIQNSCHSRLCSGLLSPMLHTQPPSRGEGCFHFADEETEGQKGRMTCSRSYTARAKSRCRAQVSVYLHHPWPPHPTAHSPAIVSLSSSSRYPLLCLSKSSPPQNFPKACSNRVSMLESCFLLLAPAGTLLSVTTRVKETKKPVQEVPPGCSLPQLYVCWSSCPRERDAPKGRPHLLFSVGPPHQAQDCVQSQ